MLTDLIAPSATKSFKLVGYGLALALLVGTHTAAYMKGRSDVEAKYASATVEQLEKDLSDNAERIERQVTTINAATARYQAQADRLEEAINANAEANTNPACNLSDAEFSLFNESISETKRDVSSKSTGTLFGIEAVRGADSRRVEDEGE